MSQEENKSRIAISRVKTVPGVSINVADLLKKIEIPRLFNQLVIFLLDGSGSMTFKGKSGFSKGQEVHQAVLAVLKRLVKSNNKNSFDAAFWAFAKDSNNFYKLKPVVKYNLDNDCFNPCEYVADDSETYLDEALEA